MKTFDNWKYLMPLSWGLALIFLGGNAQVFLYISSVAILFALFYLLTVKNISLSSFKPLGFILISFAMVFALTLPILMPSLSLTKESLRSDGTDFDFVSSYSMHFESLITIFMPKFFGDQTHYFGAGSFYESMIFIGTIPLLLGIFAALHYARNRFSIFFLLLAIFPILIALGKNTPVLHFLYNFIPGFNLFRVPSRILFLFAFSAAVLAGIGFDALSLCKSKKQFQRIKLSLGSLLVVLFLATGFIFLFKDQITSLLLSIFEAKLKSAVSVHGIDYYVSSVPTIINTSVESIMRMIFVVAVVLLVLFAYCTKKIKLSSLAYLLLVFIIIELAVSGTLHLELGATEEIYDSSLSAGFLEKQEGLFRVWDLTGDSRSGDLTQAVAYKHNIQKIDGFEPFILKEYKLYYNKMAGIKEEIKASESHVLTNVNFSDVNKTVLNLLNVKYVISKKQLADEELILVNKTKDIFIYENLNAYPRAFMLGSGNEAEIIHYSPNKIVIELNTSEADVLFLSEVYLDSWIASDNGLPTEITQKDIFRTVGLSKGEHTVEFTYQPSSLTITILISSIVLLISVLLFSLL